ncbi:MAG: deoxyribodipyrimidine photo-lyase [Candidatus Kapabacteria bacterium]|nr:deoxyribodipyrimidine photo-lyase [Candidatus Kapabacteria bacterium]
MDTAHENGVIIFWFRRDLRLNDNRGLHEALRYAREHGMHVVPIFIFDTAILDKLDDKYDKRVEFIHNALHDIQQELTALGSTLVVKYGQPFDVWKQVLASHSIHDVYANHDYEPYANERDGKIRHLLRGYGVQFRTFKDQCVFEKTEILSGSEKTYTVFTPYSKAWKAKLTDVDIREYAISDLRDTFWKSPPLPIPSIEHIGFRSTGAVFPSKNVLKSILELYHQQRDYPAVEGTSRLSVHLRFGTVGIRSCVRVARQLNETWLNELIWRDFYMMILANFPHVVHHCFKPEYDAIEWRNNKDDFERWCAGITGIPIVDAGMRELNSTGYMHNRVRMIVASFLTKNLLIDWRWGEGYFAKKLLDFDLSANNGGWQWAAGSGCDAAPYFRVFNPILQTEKFDPKLEYVKRWVPEFESNTYPKPIVDLKESRERCLQVYKRALKPDND